MNFVLKTKNTILRFNTMAGAENGLRHFGGTIHRIWGKTQNGELILGGAL